MAPRNSPDGAVALSPPAAGARGTGREKSDGPAMTTEIAVLGDGAWGITAAALLARNPAHRVTLWSARAETGTRLRATRQNEKLLPGYRIPDAIALTSDIGEALGGANLLVSAIPTVFLRGTLERWRPFRRPGLEVLSLTKGSELGTFLRPSGIIRELLEPDRVAVLSGPSHAEEVIRGFPTSVVIAGEDEEFIGRLQAMFSSDRFRVYTNDDTAGVEYAAALKNVIAIAAGICDGLGFGDNAKAALTTRGLEEMARYGVALGANPDTYRGLAGMGDLITTCFSPHGRNRALGERLGRGETLAAILADTSKVCEGITTAQSVCGSAVKMGIDVPITFQVNAVLNGQKTPRDAFEELMARSSKAESGR